MAITFEQAISAREFHVGCVRSVGPRGGVKLRAEIWRRNGATQTWKTRPGAYRVPVKFGLRSYDQITHETVTPKGELYADRNCPVCYPNG